MKHKAKDGQVVDCASPADAPGASVAASDHRFRSVPVSQMRHLGTLAALVSSMPNNDPRYALFLGAGASTSSGIPAAGTLVEQWKRRVFCDEQGWLAWRPSYKNAFSQWCNTPDTFGQTGYGRWKKEWEAQFGRQPSDYALLFSYVCPDVDARQGYIERLVSGCEPGPGYIYLTSLVLAGYFQTFLTTNFDDLIHDVLFRYGGLKPVVSAFDSQVASVRLQGPRPKIIKLHGDFLYNNIRNLGSEVARLDQNMQDKFERTCESYGLIVIGYSGQDQSVMAPLRSMVHRRDRLTHGLHWCIRNSPTSQRTGSPTVEVPEELYRMWEAYPDKVHLYVVDSFDGVMEGFYSACGCNPPPEVAQPEEKALYVRLRDGLENADQTWRIGRHFSELLRSFREASARRPPQAAVDLDQADAECRDGNGFQAAGQYEAALACFDHAVELGEAALRGEIPEIHRVHAHRRLAGALTSIVQTLFMQMGGGPFRADAPDSRRVLAAIDKVIDNVRAGLSLDHRLGAPTELRGHRLNLYFNGLEATGYLLHTGTRDLTDAQTSEALGWLEQMGANVMYGDEYVKEIREDYGGAELLDGLEAWSRTAHVPPS